MYLIVILRKEWTGGTLLSQAIHAGAECVTQKWAPLPGHTRVATLKATKAQLAKLAADLIAAGIEHKPIVESEGRLAGVMTGIGLVTDNKPAVDPYIGHLRTWGQPDDAAE